VNRIWLTALLFALPLFPQTQPRLLLNPEDIARIRETSAREPWAARVRNDILQAAAAWPQSHVDKYGLAGFSLPEDGGQWSQWYVCPVHGVNLRYTAPSTHQCPIDSRRYSGWPYEQVILGRRHVDLGNAARDLALAYHLTGDRSYAERSAEILRLYADKYLQYPYHDKDGKTARSGGRALSQTLDEGVWLIPVAWAYDLLSGFDGLSADDRRHIENDLLRAAVTTIERNDTGISNWQSWHNTAMAAVAFAIGDQALADRVINGPSGFRFQMRESVLGDGLWYEGSWGYHFYALDALVQMAEMSARNGFDLWAEPSLRKMFDLPLRLSFADGTLAPFNDSRSANLANYDGMYEMAYARWQDPLLGGWLGRRDRGRSGLFWGPSTLPDRKAAALSSETFLESGYAVLRNSANDHALIVKFGSHGGWHGHYDKLSFVSFGSGGFLGLDPGTQSYAAPTHDSWDKVTLSHNTVAMDQTSQGEATGRLLWTAGDERFQAARASAGPAYARANLTRTMILTADYALDLFDVESTDGSEHTFDWIYHNEGAVETDLPLGAPPALPSSAGYQHLKNNRAATVDDAWQVRFDGSTAVPRSYGSVYASVAAVKGTFQFTRESAVSGRFAGRLGYQVDGAGYLLFTTPALAGQPAASAPTGLTVMVYGDGSGHRLSLRMNDATDERFSVVVGPVDWTGWKQVRVTDPARWSHFLGNNDGVVDVPLRNVGLQLDRVAGSPASGAILIDDLQVNYGENEVLTAADFEIAVRSLRLWMLPEANTTVMTGEGLGPDLTIPVPYVLARRRAVGTRFVTLLEPYDAAPGVLRFERAVDGDLLVAGPGFTDRYRVTADGVTRVTE
jgi:hypothetical protein